MHRAALAVIIALYAPRSAATGFLEMLGAPLPTPIETVIGRTLEIRLGEPTEQRGVDRPRASRTPRGRHEFTPNSSRRSGRNDVGASGTISEERPPGRRPTARPTLA